MENRDCVKWKAPWIWLQKYKDSDSIALLARREFELEEIPSNAEPYISAHHIYRLYVNGRLLGRGPDRSDPRFPYFDTYALGEYLCIGQNVVLIVAYHCRTKLRAWPLYDGPGGISVQIQLGEEEMLSDETWRMTQAEMWISTSQTPSRFRPPVQHIDLSHEIVIKEAMLPEYDDCRWEIPSAFTGKKEEIYAPPVEAECPPLIPISRMAVHGGSISASAEICKKAMPRNLTGFSPEKLTLRPEDSSSWIIYDFGRSMGGFPLLEFESEGNGIMELYGGESLAWQLEDVLQFSKSDLWSYESLDWRGLRYLAIHLKNLGAPITIHKVAFIEMVYPFKDEGDFRCSNSSLSRLWKTCRETARIGIKDHPVDCIGREQALWLGDLNIHARSLAGCFGDLRPIEKAIRQIFRVMSEKGVIPVPGPSAMGYSQNQNTLAWADAPLATSTVLLHCYKYSGEIELIREMFPKLILLYKHFAQYEESRGLLDTQHPSLPSLSIFGGWGPIQKNGVNAILNFEYIVSLESAAKLAAAIGLSEVSLSWREKAERVRAACVAAFWDPDRCIFKDGEMDGVASDAVSVTANAWGALADALNPRQAGSWAEFLLHDSSVFPLVSPYDASILLEAFCQLDLDLHVRELLEAYFCDIISNGEKTLPEFWSAGVNGAKFRGDLSRCHPYGSAPAYLLQEFVLGVRCIQPGWKKIHIEPHFLGLKSASGRVPTPHGSIEIQWDREPLTWNMHLNLPAGIEAEIIIPRMGWGDQRVWQNGNLIQEIKGWSNFAAHYNRDLSKVAEKKIHISLKMPGRHVFEIES